MKSDTGQADTLKCSKLIFTKDSAKLPYYSKGCTDSVQEQNFRLLVQVPFSYWHCVFSEFQECRHISNTHSNLWETFHIHNWAFISDCSTKWQSYNFLEKNKWVWLSLNTQDKCFHSQSETFSHGYKAEGNSDHLSENHTLEVQQVQHFHTFTALLS